MARKTIEETLAGLRRQVRAIETRGADEDPWVMGDLLKIQNEMTDTIGRMVARNREVGYSWDEIGRETGMTRQGAYNRWHRYCKGQS